MSRLSNEILNKYIDGDLDEAARKKVYNQLEFSGADRKRYIELNSVHQGLKRLKPEEVPVDFTSVLMSSLLKRKKAKKEQAVFIYSVGSVFVLACLVITGILMAMLFSGSSSGSTGKLQVLDDSVNFIGKVSGEIVSGFSGINIPVLGSVLSLFIFLSAYFFFDSIRQTRNWLKKIN
jgi:anti-sigma factor RsiW